MARQRTKSIIQLEWFNVTYKSIFVVLAVGVLALAGFGSYWYLTQRYLPRHDAVGAIEQAEQRLDETKSLDVEALRATVERAGVALDEARQSFTLGEFDDARFKALHSADLSAQALDFARGNAHKHQVRFYRIEGDVRVKRAAEFAWESAGPNTALGVGDQVKTSSSGSAQLIYFDGTVTTIEPGSLLEIRDLFEDPVTKVRRVKEKLNFGELRASTPKRNVRGSYHEVATDKVAARAEQEGEFRVAYDRQAETTVIDIFSGQIEVAAGGKRASLVAGERINAASDGRLSAKEALPGVPRLLVPSDQRVYILENPRDQHISLSWDAVPGASGYQLMISNKALFTDPLYDARRDEVKAELEVGSGSYYWKVAAINVAGVRGPFSESRGFRVSSEKIRDRDDTLPPDLQITEFVTIGMMVIVNGRCEPGAALWVDDEKVDVYDDGRFYAVVRLRKEGVNELRFRAQDTAGNETALTRSTYVELY